MIRRFRRCCKCCKLRVDFHIPGFGIFDLDACIFLSVFLTTECTYQLREVFFVAFFWVDQRFSGKTYHYFRVSWLGGIVHGIDHDLIAMTGKKQSRRYLGERCDAD